MTGVPEVEVRWGSSIGVWSQRSGASQAQLEGIEVGVGPGVDRSRTGGCVGGCVGARGRVGSQQTTGGDWTWSKLESDWRLLLEVVLEPEVE